MPRKEPLSDVDRAVFVTVHHQATVLVETAIRPLPEWHVLLVLARMTHPGGIALAYYREFFPKAQTLVGKYLHKAIETPVIVHHAVANASPGALFGVTPVIIKPSGDTDTDRAGDSLDR